MVHGLTGNGVSSWTSATGTYWPDLIANEPVMSDFDVYVYQYPTKFFGDCMAVSDLANDLRLRLEDAGIFSTIHKLCS